MSSTSTRTSGEDSVSRLIRAAHAGDQKALGRLFEGYREYLLVIARSNLDEELSPKGGPSDLVQETFLEAQRDFGGFHGEDRDAIARWLRELLRNNLTDFVRRHRLAKRRSVDREQSFNVEGNENWEDFLASDSSTPSARAAANEQEERLHAAMEQLPADYRDVIRLRHIARQPWSAVAAQMGRTEGAVQKLWVRALELLRSHFSVE